MLRLVGGGRIFRAYIDQFQKITYPGHEELNSDRLNTHQPYICIESPGKVFGVVSRVTSADLGGGRFFWHHHDRELNFFCLMCSIWYFITHLACLAADRTSILKISRSFFASSAVVLIAFPSTTT